MVIKISDYIKHCYTNQDGEKIFRIIKPLIESGQQVNVSFKSIDSVTSSFVNSAFIELLEYVPFKAIKTHLTFSNSPKEINNLIKRRFHFETTERQPINQYPSSTVSDLCC